jgi:hypothetical protein
VDSGGRSERRGETVTGVGGRQAGFLCVSCGPEEAGWMLPFRIGGRRLTEWDYCLRCVLQAACLNAALSYVPCCCCRLRSSSTALEPELSPFRGQTPAQAEKGAPEPGPGYPLATRLPSAAVSALPAAQRWFGFARRPKRANDHSW